MPLSFINLHQTESIILNHHPPSLPYNLLLIAAAILFSTSFPNNGRKVRLQSFLSAKSFAIRASENIFSSSLCADFSVSLSLPIHSLFLSLSACYEDDSESEGEKERTFKIRV
ncbi:hypothetical protein AAHE18_18G067200 [Arachis hypogaea]|nr:uncharacterized protein DS421_18g608790 [Arachis hypogaea]